jgi:hypothetical protein
VNTTVTALPLCLGAATAATAWIVLQVLVLAVALGKAGGSPAGAAPALARSYAVGTMIAAGAAVGLGAAVCTRLLMAREVRARAARRVAHGQSLALVAPMVLFGQLSTHPSALATGLLLAGTLAGSWLGARAGASAGGPS